MRKIFCLLLIFCLVSPCFAESVTHNVLGWSAVINSNALMYKNGNYFLGALTSAGLIYKLSHNTTGLITGAVCFIYDIVRACKGDGYAYIPLSLFTLKIVF